MGKALLYFVLCIVGCGGLVLLTFSVLNSAIYSGPTQFKSFSEFDFSSYAFGIVAVAVSFAGVYISIVPDKCNDQLLNILTVHLTPDPFSDLADLERKCHPDQVVVGYTRTEGLKGAYALVVLKRWVSLDETTRDKCLGTHGISSVRSWLGSGYRFLESQSDRLIITTLGTSVSVLYVFIPAAYYFHSEKLAASLIAVIYLLCITEMLLCAFLYTFRHLFVRIFEDRMSSWKEQINNHLLTAQERSVPKLDS